VENIIDDPMFFNSARSQQTVDDGYFPASKAIPAGTQRFNIYCLLIHALEEIPIMLTIDILTILRKKFGDDNWSPQPDSIPPHLLVDFGDGAHQHQAESEAVHDGGGATRRAKRKSASNAPAVVPDPKRQKR
jgi:hypothetical protein